MSVGIPAGTGQILRVILMVEQKKSKATGILALVVLCLIGYGAWQIWAPVNAAIQQAGKPDTSLEVTGFDWKDTGRGSPRIVGTVVNHSQKAYRYASVEFSLYDKSGAQVGTALANIGGLDPGGRWNFEALVLQKGDLTAKLKGVTGF